MPKRGRLLLLVPLALLVAGLVWAASREREPSYLGRTLSEWAEVTQTNEVAGIFAIRQIGTNALPFAVKWLRYESAPWKNKMVRSLYRLPRPVRPRTLSRWIFRSHGPDHNYHAFMVLAALGSDAGPIAPELLRLSKMTSRGGTGERAIEALGFLGTNGLPQLLEILRNPQHPHRPDAATVIGELLEEEPGAKPAIPVLIECLADPDPNVVLQASDALAFIPPTTDSRPAVLALRKNLGNSDEAIRRAATNALQSLAPQVFTNSPPP